MLSNKTLLQRTFDLNFWIESYYIVGWNAVTIDQSDNNLWNSIMLTLLRSLEMFFFLMFAITIAQPHRSPISSFQWVKQKTEKEQKQNKGFFYGKHLNQKDKITESIYSVVLILKAIWRPDSDFFLLLRKTIEASVLVTRQKNCASI